MLWKETNDVYSLTPKFETACPICGKGTLILRSSYITTLVHNPKAWKDDRSMKCTECKVVLSFGPPLRPEYAQKIIKARGERALSTNDLIALWKKEPVLAQQLKVLGYI